MWRKRRSCSGFEVFKKEAKMKSIRIAPKCGYDTPEKQEYRENVWRDFFGGDSYGFFSPWYWGKDWKVLIMPSKEGLEINQALSRCYACGGEPLIRQDQIVIVDNNPAIVASLKRKYPKINTRGLDIKEAIKREAAIGSHFALLNIDLCGTAKTIIDVANFIHDFTPNIFIHMGMVAFTFLNGRDQKNFLPYYLTNKKKQKRSWGKPPFRDGFGFRINEIHRALQFGSEWKRKFKKADSNDGCDCLRFKEPYMLKPIREGRYNSNGHLPMGWIIFRIYHGTGPNQNGYWHKDGTFSCRN